MQQKLHTVGAKVTLEHKAYLSFLANDLNMTVSDLIRKCLPSPETGKKQELSQSQFRNIQESAGRHYKPEPSTSVHPFAALLQQRLIENRKRYQETEKIISGAFVVYLLFSNALRK